MRWIVPSTDGLLSVRRDHGELSTSGRRYDNALIVGQGRSGTDWLLDLLDLSERTYCRSEANEIPDGAMSALPDCRFVGTHDDLLSLRWDDVVATVATHMGERDHHVRGRKVFAHRVPHAINMNALLRRPKARRLLSYFAPALRRGEWKCPAWLFDTKRLAHAFPVIKLVQVPGWGCICHAEPVEFAQ